MTDKELQQLLAEDARRRARTVYYDPVAGDPAATGRVEVTTPVPGLPRARVPASMAADPGIRTNDPLEWKRLRCRHDFEYWCAECVTIKHKTEGRDVRLHLNAPQRRVARLLEGQRRAGQPVRAIMLKARQWGGSTLVQTYMAWIQSCLRTNWHSIICSQVKDTSTGIRGMYTKILENYPEELWEGDAKPTFKPYERSGNVREITGRGCRVTVASAENQDAVRGADFAMAHLTEIAYWKSTPGKSPEDTIRAIVGSVPLIDGSLVVLESTANGVGNYFHRQWMAAREGAAGRLAVFVPWYEIEYYRLAPPSREAVARSLDDYGRRLWELGCDLDQIYWYNCKLAELGTRDKMMAEFPTTDEEAFTATGRSVFPPDMAGALRSGCREGRRGGFGSDGRWVDGPDGDTVMWQAPDADGDYVAAVDVGGRSDRADYSVVAVVRRDGPLPEVVAQWRGHIDHDLLAAKAMALGRLYNDALLVVESNTFESRGFAGTYVLDRLAREYANVYCRRAYDDLRQTETTRVGFHTNRATKEMLVAGLIAHVRSQSYIERDSRAVDELLTYEELPDGSYAAKPGCHDDLLMTRAIALHIIDHQPPVPPAASLLPRLRGW